MEETGGASAYGAALAGAEGFDFLKFIRQPRTIVRLLSWVSAPRPEFVFQGTGGGFKSSDESVNRCAFSAHVDIVCMFGLRRFVEGFHRASCFFSQLLCVRNVGDRQRRSLSYWRFCCQRTKDA